MKLILTTDFQPDHDTRASVRVKNEKGTLLLTILMFYGDGDDQVQFINHEGLSAIGMLSLGKAAAELVDAIINGDEQLTEIEI